MVDYKPVVFGIVVILILGMISIFAHFLDFFIRIILAIMAIIIGGLAAAYTTDGDNKDGGVNGAISGIFGGALLGVLLPALGYNEFSFLVIFVGIFIGIVFGYNFGIIGAVIGNKIKKDPPEKPKFTGYLVCNNCEEYYGLFEGESPDDFDLNCKCGGKLEYQKSLRLKMDWKLLGAGIIFGLLGVILLISRLFLGPDPWPGRIVTRAALICIFIATALIWSSYLKSRGIDW